MGGIIHVIIVVPPLLLWLLKNSIKLSLDPLLCYQREEHLYFLNRPQNPKKIGLLKKVVLVQKSCVRSFAGCAELNLAGLLGLVSQVRRFSPANQGSAEITRHVLVTVRFAWNLNRGGTEKTTEYHVLYPVENPPKVNRNETYRAVPCSGNIITFLYQV